MHFTLHELDLSSWGAVTAIEPCPPIAAGQGQVVTGRFTTRQVEEITRVQLEDGTELSGTPVHPVWSVDRQDWIPLGSLQPAERLLSRRGELAVIAVATSLWRQPVYNLEVHGEHVYEVADAGVLVHNSYESNALKGALSNANFAQKTFSEAFSQGGKFAGKTIDEVADALRRGMLKPLDVPLEYVARAGQTIILNTRPAEALRRAGIPRELWHGVDVSDDAAALQRLAEQLRRNGLGPEGISAPRPSRGGN